MKNRIVRTILLLLAVAAAGGAGFVVVTLEQRATAARTGELSVRDQVAAALEIVAGFSIMWATRLRKIEL